jgi:hypothetical protein
VTFPTRTAVGTHHIPAVSGAGVTTCCDFAKALMCDVSRLRA